MTRDQALAKIALAVGFRFRDEAEEILDAAFARVGAAGPSFAPPGCVHATIISDGWRYGEVTKEVIPGAWSRDPMRGGGDLFIRQRGQGGIMTPIVNLDLELSFGPAKT